MPKRSVFPHRQLEYLAVWCLFGSPTLVAAGVLGTLVYTGALVFSGGGKFPRPKKLKRLRPAAVLFLLYVLRVLSRATHGQRIHFLRKNIFWDYFRDYFPCTVIHDFNKAELDPSKKYVIGCHPHGVIGLSFWSNIGAENGVLPGINYRLATVSANFRIPFISDFLLAMGFADASPTNLKKLLQKNISTAIVIGGAAEALDSRPRYNDLTLIRRIGFVKLALEEGADLIPVYGFGETDLYSQLVPNPRGSIVRWGQEKFLSWFGFTIPLVKGRWRTGFWAMPRRAPLFTVVGRPIPVEKHANPSIEVIMKYHRLYVDALTTLFDDYKFLVNTSDLRVVDKLKKRDRKKIDRLSRL